MTELYYETMGVPHERPSLLLVHGMFATSRMWDLNLAALAEHFHLVMPDLPGHGKSAPICDERDAKPEALIAALDRIREKLGIERWFICGQSLGAGLTLNYALAHPSRVIAQAFTNSRTTIRDASSPQETEHREERLSRIREGGRAAMRREVFHPAHAKRFPQEIKTVLANDADLIDIESYLLLIGSTSPALSLFGRNSAPEVPTLLVNGRHERAFQSSRDELAVAWPNLEIVDIDGGHAVNIENPDGFNEQVFGFFARFSNARQHLQANV